MAFWKSDPTDTVFSLASGSLPSAVAVVRVSGPLAIPIAEKLFVGGRDLHSRGMHFGKLTDEKGVFLDRILLLTFCSPHSFTGEDVAEFHCHGSHAVVEGLRRAILFLGARQAKRGEFNFRALFSGKTDPSEVEVLADVFRAESPSELAQIYSRKAGSIEVLAKKIRSSLLSLQAVLDTAVDFSEEYSNVVHSSGEYLQQVSHECSKAIHRYSRFHDGSFRPRIVLVGRPNVGKSSLFNALLGRERVLVHELPGTTRDVVEENIELAGQKSLLVDTAGIRSTSNPVEGAGVEMGRLYLRGASLWILVVDGSHGLEASEQALLDEYSEIPHLIVWNKADLPQCEDKRESISTSAVTGEGIDRLWSAITHHLESSAPMSDSPLPSASQQRVLTRIQEGMQDIERGLADEVPPEVLAEKNRNALQGAEDLIGAVTPDDILEKIFSEFCI